MQIQVNTDSSIEGSARLVRQVEKTVTESLDRFADRITRIEVHLSDANAQKGGQDIRCVMEARPAGLDPVAVDAQTEDVTRSVQDSVGKLERALESRLGKLGRR